MEAEQRLFRPEAISHLDRIGKPFAAAGISGWVITLFMACAVLAAIIFAATTAYARKETVVGSLMSTSGMQQVVTPRSGSVVAVLAREGQAVRSGDRLLELSYDGETRDGLHLSRLRALAMDAQGQAQDEAFAARMSSLAAQSRELAVRKQNNLAEIKAIADDIHLQVQRVSLAQQTVDAASSLVDRQLMAPLQMRQRQEALIAAQQQFSALRREQRRLVGEREQLVVQASRMQAETEALKAQAADVHAQLDEREAAVLADAGGTLSARIDGRLASLDVRPGAAVQAGQVLAAVVPADATLEAELWLPTRAAGFARPGDTVRLMYDAFPYQKFGVGIGRITTIATAPSKLPPSNANPSGEPMYRVVVSLQKQHVDAFGRAWTLAPGMALSADLVLEERPLLSWLFEPLLRLQQRTAKA
jgi:membrane fusion protein